MKYSSSPVGASVSSSRIIELKNQTVMRIKGGKTVYSNILSFRHRTDAQSSLDSPVCGEVGSGGMDHGTHHLTLLLSPSELAPYICTLLSNPA